MEKKMKFVGLLIGGVIGTLVACTNSVTKEVKVNDPFVKPIQVENIEVEEIEVESFDNSKNIKRW